MRFASKAGSGWARGTATRARGAGVGWRSALLVSAVVLVACGGSTSETPWPAEPIDLEPGPAGEVRQGGNVVDTQKLPDNYTKRGVGGGEPSSDDEVDPDDDPLGPEALPESDE